MDTKTLIKQVTEGLNEAGPEQCEAWHTQLASLFGWTAAQLAEVKRDRAKQEIEIKQQLLKENNKYTEKEIERIYFSTEQGMYYSYASEILKAISKLIVACKFKVDALKGRL